MIPAIVRVVLDEGEVKCVPLTPETTARDVIECCRDPDEPFCTLTQTTRDGERVLALHERPLLLIQGQQEVGERVTFVLRYDMTQDVREDTGSADDGMKGPQPASTQLPDGVELTLSELREMAGRQQQQIDDHQQQLVAKEQRLKYLKQQESRHQAMNSETERLRRLRERVEAQELKLRKLRALRGQSEQQRVNNNALSVDLENIRALFNEKEKELSLAVARVEEMTRQLEEVRRGRELRQGPQGDTHRELEKLRRELMYRNKLNEQQHSQLASQTETLGQRRDEMARIDQRIAELQQRLHRKRVHNQQLASQLHAASAAKRQVRQTSAKTLPAPAPLRTKDDMGSEPADFGLNKSDPKYQTLPYNTKFHMKEAGVPERQEEPEPAAAPPPGPRPAGPRAPPLGGTLSQGGPLPQTILPQPYGQRPPTQPPPARASGLPRPVAPSVSANTSSSARLQGGAAPPLPNNLHADPAEVNGERPLLPPKPASGPPPSKPTASRLNGEAVPEAPPPTGLTGDVSQVSVRGTQAKGPPHPYRYASRSQIASTYTNQHRPENGQLPQQQEQQDLINSYQQHLQQQQFQKQQQLQHQFQQQHQQQQQQQQQQLQQQQLQQQKQQQELQQQRQEEEGPPVLPPSQQQLAQLAPPHDLNDTTTPRGRTVPGALPAAVSGVPLTHLQEINSDMEVPGLLTYLPHLLGRPDALTPALHVSQGRRDVTVVMGLPTVKREVQNYLISTLKNLIDSMSESERLETLIVVFIAETDAEYCSRTAQEIQDKFPAEVKSGLVDIISPSAEYYPPRDSLRRTLDDPLERVQWRTKQNLDFAFLMMYCRPRGVFYVQLEDDIMTKPGYVTKMKEFALQKISEKKDWLLLDFCQLGFIGKLFKTVDLLPLIHFLVMFNNDKPSDWLLLNLVHTKVCRFDKSAKKCKEEKDKVWLHYKPSLFQHIGTHSSLKGKVQKLKDKQFGKVQMFKAHSNPPARVVCDIKPHKQYTLERAYRGETYFWGLLPQPGDHLEFHLTPPVTLTGFMFQSGNVEHPSDRFYNTTVEIVPALAEHELLKRYKTTSDGYAIIGQFDDQGVAAGSLDPTWGPIRSLRLAVQAESDNWVILSEIHLKRS